MTEQTGSPSPAECVAGSVAVVESALAALVGDDLTAWSGGQVRDGLRVLLAQVNRLDALIADVVGEFDQRGLSEPDGFRTTRAWLVAFGRLSQRAASGHLTRSRLAPQLPALAAAGRAGRVSAEQVRKVAGLAAHVGVDKVAEFDDILADLAASSGPVETDQACQRIRAHVDPDGADPDPDASARRTLSIAKVGSLFNVSGKLDAEGGAILLTALNAMTRPPTAEDTRTAGQRRADAAVELARQLLAAGELPTVGGIRPQLGILLTPQALLAWRPNPANPNPHAAGGPAPDEPAAGPRSPGPRASATTASGRAATAGSEPGASTDSGGEGWRPPPDWLEECAGIPMRPDLPWNEWAHELPIDVVERLACDCEIWRVVMDPLTGLPLEVGRAHRVVPHWIRKALVARDRGCRWTGCTAPPAWCEAHHLLSWLSGGTTDVDHLTLLCRHHHGLVHEGRPDETRWGITLDHTTGEIHITRPDGQPYELGPSQPHRERSA